MWALVNTKRPIPARGNVVSHHASITNTGGLPKRSETGISMTNIVRYRTSSNVNTQTALIQANGKAI